MHYILLTADYPTSKWRSRSNCNYSRTNDGRYTYAFKTFDWPFFTMSRMETTDYPYMEAIT